MRPLQAPQKTEGKIHVITYIPQLVGILCAISRNGIRLFPSLAGSTEHLAVSY